MWTSWWIVFVFFQLYKSKNCPQKKVKGTPLERWNISALTSVSLGSSGDLLLGLQKSVVVTTFLNSAPSISLYDLSQNRGVQQTNTVTVTSVLCCDRFYHATWIFCPRRVPPPNVISQPGLMLRFPTKRYRKIAAVIWRLSSAANFIVM
jgi:hypothetical protein